MPKRTKATGTDATGDPNRLVRQQAGSYRTADERFEVREGGGGWFVLDSEQQNELGQELVLGPFATLKAVGDALPDARRSTLKSLPGQKKARRRAAGGAERAPKASPHPERTPAPKRAQPEHPLRRILADAAWDRFPPDDPALEVLPPPERTDAVIAFSGHNLVAAAVERDEVLAQLPDDDPGGPMSAAFLGWLADRLGSQPGSLDVVLVGHPSWGPARAERRVELVRLEDLDPDGNEMVARAHRYRSDVTVHADEDASGIVIVGRGLVGRMEVSIEVRPDRRGQGIGVTLARAALQLVPEGEALFAQVSPGNVASLRAFLKAGYRPICSEVLLLRGD